MKRLVLSFVAFIAINIAFAQTPNQFKYQAVLRDETGNIIASAAKTVVIDILQASATGTSVFTETHNVTTTAQGIINLNVGSVNTVGISTINWAANTYFIKITVGGVEMGTSQLLSVPYSLYSAKAGNGLSDADAEKLSGIEANAEVNVNADWNAPNGDSQILNKPILFSGNYNDLTSKPVIPTKLSDLNNDLNYLSSNFLYNYWNFDGNTLDNGVSIINSTNYGATLSTDRNGNSNAAYNFDGTSNYIRLEKPLSITNSFTISCWVLNQNNTSNLGAILCDGSVSAGGNDFVYGLTQNRICVRADKNGATLNFENSSPVALANVDIYNKWVHLVWVASPSATSIYLNGVLLGEFSELGSNNGFHDSYAYIGARNVWGTTDSYFKGKIDELMIFNYSLTKTEIETLYASSQIPADAKTTNMQLSNIAAPVNANDVANKEYVDVLLDKILRLEAELGVTDIDGNHYQAVKIGNQVWMKQNLKVTKYRDGSAIPNITLNTSWTSQTSGAYCDFANNPTNGITYGHLYNYYAVADSKQLCPVNWHIPTNTEWTTLISYLGGINNATNKLKEIGILHWDSPNNGNNSSGFTALAGSWRGGDATFYYYVGYDTWWWTSTLFDATNPWYIGIDNNLINNSYQNSPYFGKNAGLSIRCIKD